MINYYLLHMLALTLTQIYGLVFMKKFQLSAGTSLRSNTLFMIINGTVSAIVPVFLIMVQKSTLQFTCYSFLMATIIVILSAIDAILRLKAYEQGQIAIVNIVSTLGSIIFSCLWGVLVLHESVSVLNIVAIGIMLVAVLIVSRTDNEKINLKLLWIYAIISLSNSFVNIFSKQHQVEKTFATVDTMSFCVWVGIVRTAVFLVIALILLLKQGRQALRFSRSSAGYATIASVVAITSYIITLITSVVLPIVVTSPLGVGFGIVMSVLLPWIVYREHLSKRQWLGAALSLLGTLMFLMF